MHSSTRTNKCRRYLVLCCRMHTILLFEVVGTIRTSTNVISLVCVFPTKKDEKTPKNATVTESVPPLLHYLSLAVYAIFFYFGRRSTRLRKSLTRPGGRSRRMKALHHRIFVVFRRPSAVLSSIFIFREQDSGVPRVGPVLCCLRLCLLFDWPLTSRQQTLLVFQHPQQARLSRWSSEWFL